MYRILLVICFAPAFLFSNDLYYKFFENEGLLPDNVIFWAKSPHLDIFLTEKGLTFHNYRLIEKNDSILSEKQSFLMKFDNNISNIIEYESTGRAEFNIFKHNSASSSKPFDSLRILNFQPGKDILLKFENNKFRFDIEINELVSDKSFEFELLSKDNFQLLNNNLEIETKFDKLLISDIDVIQNSNTLDYKLLQDNNRITIKPVNCEPNQKLIIDPLIYSTYIGGDSYDIGKEIEIDDKGNIIIAGNTSSIDFPSTEGAYEELFYETEMNYPDLFVSKFDSAGNLLFSTFIGSYGDDYAEALKIKDSVIYLAGYTYSFGTFPETDDAIENDTLGAYDIFFLKLSAAGDSLLYSTLYGGTQDDIPQDIELFNNRVAITGYSGKDGEYPATSNSFNDINAGKYDGFLTILDENNYNVIYSSLFGGSEDDFSQSLHFLNNRLYITGITHSFDFDLINPGENDKFNLDSNNTESDAFLAEFNLNSLSFDFIGFLGGSGSDKAYGIDSDSQGDIFVAGYTESNDFPVTQNAYDTHYNELSPAKPLGDVFVTKFRNNSVYQSGYLGHDGTERALALAIYNDDVFITGSTTSLRFPVSSNCFDSTYNSIEFEPDAFISRFDNDISVLKYSTYFGGDSNDIGYDIVISNNFAYVTGRTNSSDFPLSINAFDSTRNDIGFSDAFLIMADTDVLSAYIPDSVYVCKGKFFELDLKISGYKNSFTVNVEPDTMITVEPSGTITFFNEQSMYFEITVADGSGQEITKTLKAVSVDNPKPEILGHRKIIADSVYSYFLREYYSLNDYKWEIENGIILNDDDTSFVNVIWYDTLGRELRVYETNQYGCMDYDSAFAVDYIKYRTNISIIEGDTVVCKGNFAVLDAGEGFAHYYWNDYNRSRLDTVYTEGYYWAVFEDEEGYGGLTDTVFMRFIDAPQPEITGDTIVQIGEIQLYRVEYKDYLDYNWLSNTGRFIDDSTHIGKIIYDSTGYNNLIAEVSNGENCSGFDTLEVLAGNFRTPVISFNGNKDICDGDSVIADAGYGYAEYLWNDGTETRFNVIYDEGDYWCEVIDILGNKLYSDTITIKTYPSPNKPLMAMNNGYLRCYAAAYGYEWYVNGELIPDSTNRILYPFKTGHYQVRVLNQYGCGAFSDSVFVVVNSISDKTSEGIKIEGSIIYIPENIADSYAVYDYLGRLISKNKIKTTGTKINLNNYTGFVILFLFKNDEVEYHKYIITR